MDAVEYIKEAKRLCKSRSLCNSVSGKCPLLDENGRCTATADICAEDIIEKTEKEVGKEPERPQRMVNTDEKEEEENATD